MRGYTYRRAIGRIAAPRQASAAAVNYNMVDERQASYGAGTGLTGIATLGMFDDNDNDPDMDIVATQGLMN